MRRRGRRSSFLLAVISLAIFLLAFQQLSTARFLFITTQLQSQSQSGTYQRPDQSSANNHQLQYQSIPLQGQVPRRTDNNSTFSACLLVADDNHYLIEWLAFHYHTLPLRYLVITSDPRARTTPDLILDRWHPYMTIVRWSDQDFLPPLWLKRIPPEHDPIAKLTKHRERQRHFYPACFQFLKQAGREWVMVIDVDEFALHNTHYNATSTHTHTRTGTNTSTSDNDTQPYPNSTNAGATTHTTDYNQHTQKSPSTSSPIISTSPTILDAIQYYYPFPNTSCITVPRLRFGNVESTNTTHSQTNYSLSNQDKRNVPPGFDDKNFLTYRFRWRAALSSRAENKPPKSMIHVGRIANFSRKDTDAHRPVRSACPRNHLYTLPQDSPFVIHHYVGTEQQFRFRNDARDGTKTRSDHQLQLYNRIQHAYDQSACTWMKSFVEQMGNDAAQSLLEGVGDVAYSLYL